MNVDLPFDTVDGAVQGGFARELQHPGETPCADELCVEPATVAWLQQSILFHQDEEGRASVKECDLWFPLCDGHAPLQRVATIPDATGDSTDASK